jgi:hypothetical protein
LVWPTRHDERVFLARRLFGQVLVETMDYYIKEATDFASNPTADGQFEIENHLSCTERAYRGCFASMARKQREITLHLIRQLTSRPLISSLTRLDQFGFADENPYDSFITFSIQGNRQDTGEAVYPSKSKGTVKVLRRWPSSCTADGIVRLKQISQNSRTVGPGAP